MQSRGLSRGLSVAPQLTKFLIIGMGFASIATANAGSSPETLRISAPEAAARALNTLQASEDGFILHHPRHEASFTPDGVRVQPKHGPAWGWRYLGSNLRSSVAESGADGTAIEALGDLGGTNRVPEAVPPRPTSPNPLEIRYERGAIAEVYRLESGTIEQQFVIAFPPSLDEGELVLDGAIDCVAPVSRDAAGWSWRDEEGAVTLGDVHVFDASGKTLPAAMSIDGRASRIVVDGAALAAASYPVTIDPEIGTNDFRVSDMGTDGDFTWDGQFSDVAYNATNNQYLVVWEGDDNVGTLIDGEFEIFGQRVDATSGASIGTNDFRISDMGVNGAGTADGVSPAVAWNSVNNEYLVVWSGDDATGAMIDNEYEIFGQRIAGATGAELGTNDFRLSDMGADGESLRDAQDPDVAYDAALNQYLVVWSGDDVTDEEFEIYGQRVAGATGAEVGTDSRLSDMGTDGDPLFDATVPQVAFSTTAGEYLVVWQGDDNSGVLVNGEFEVWGQRVNASTGAEAGTDFRISDMGPDGVDVYDAEDPAVSYASAENRYLVVWSGDDNSAGLVEGEREIFGQLLDGTTGAALGTNDFRISDMGPDGDPLYDAIAPAVGYDAAGHQFLVAWEGDDKGGGLGDGEFEIFGQRLNASSGAAVGDNDFAMSDIGTAGLTNVGASRPTVAVRTSGTVEFLVCWDADTDLNGLSDNEYEIYGQRLRNDGVETGTDDFRLSDMGPDGDIDWDARQPAVAYNPNTNEYLVVWEGDDNTAPLVDGETEIFGQRINASSGAEVGTNDFRISDMGPDGDPGWDAQKPAVVYNPNVQEYLVVWSGEDNIGAMAAGEFEIFGQRLSGATCAEVGTNDFRISDMGPDGNNLYGALNPAVAYDATASEYLVVWEGDDLGGTLVEGEFEIFGQRLADTGFAVGANDFRISDMGPDSDLNYSAVLPKVAWGSSGNQYLVVWAGEDNTGLLVPGEFEIYGQLLDAQGVQTGTNDFRISTAGADGDDTYDAFDPDLAYNSANNQYLVVWDGEDLGGLLAPGEKEIFGQRLSAAGAQIGTDDFRISDLGPDGDPLYDAESPSVTYDTAVGEYIVVWEGDDDSGANGETEIWGQRLDGATGAELGDNDFRLSDMGLDGDPASDATDPTIASAAPDRVLVLWRGDDETGGLGSDEFEIFGQVFTTGAGTSGVEPLTAAPSLALSISPNPMRASGRIELASPYSGPAEVTLIDITGRVRWSRVVSAAAGSTSIPFDASSLRNGAYFVRVSSGSASITRKLIVSR